LFNNHQKPPTNYPTNYPTNNATTHNTTNYPTNNTVNSAEPFCYDVLIKNTHEGSYYTYNTSNNQKFYFNANNTANTTLHNNTTPHYTTNNTTNTTTEDGDWEYSIPPDMQKSVANFYAAYDEHGSPWQALVVTVFCDVNNSTSSDDVENTSSCNWAFQCEFIYPDNTKKRCVVPNKKTLHNYNSNNVGGDAMEM